MDLFKTTQRGPIEALCQKYARAVFQRERTITPRFGCSRALLRPG